jgi:hypothetical protein
MDAHTEQKRLSRDGGLRHHIKLVHKLDVGAAGKG